jgi:hypothetical protein
MQLDRQSCKVWSSCRILRLGFKWSVPRKGLHICTFATGVGGTEIFPIPSFSARLEPWPPGELLPDELAQHPD